MPSTNRPTDRATDPVSSCWNRGAEQLKARSRIEAVGRPIADFYTPEDVAAGVPAAVLQRAAERGSDFTRGWRLRGSGSRFWASVVTTALYDERGGVRGYLKIVRDETTHLAEEWEH
jgi:PAS domain S-box-containing protein